MERRRRGEAGEDNLAEVEQFLADMGGIRREVANHGDVGFRQNWLPDDGADPFGVPGDVMVEMAPLSADFDWGTPEPEEPESPEWDPKTESRQSGRIKSEPASNKSPSAAPRPRRERSQRVRGPSQEEARAVSAAPAVKSEPRSNPSSPPAPKRGRGRPRKADRSLIAQFNARRAATPAASAPEPPRRGAKRKRTEREVDPETIVLDDEDAEHDEDELSEAPPEAPPKKRSRPMTRSQTVKAKTTEAKTAKEKTTKAKTTTAKTRKAKTAAATKTTKAKTATKAKPATATKTGKAKTARTKAAEAKVAKAKAAKAATTKAKTAKAKTPRKARSKPEPQGEPRRSERLKKKAEEAKKKGEK